MDQLAIPLRQFLLRDRTARSAVPDVVALMEDIAQATRRISFLVGQGALGSALGSAGTANVQGEDQKKLDVVTNEVMIECLEYSGHWAGLASEEMDDAISTPTEYGLSRYLCLFDPVDGSSNLDINGTVGTIFSILRCPEGVREPATEHFLQPGTAQVAAGFTVYGPSTVLVLTTGRGVNGFTLDRGSGEYLLTHPGLTIKPDATDFTVNMANKRYWTLPIQRYIDECIQGAQGQRGVHFNMRWMGSMVADVYRLFHSGGIFLYPWDSKVPGRPGKLRLMYEINPVSFIVEQAGGASTTGHERPLDLVPESLHQRCPVILGSKNEVDRVVAYHLEHGT